MKRSIFYSIPLVFLLTATACNENPVYSSPKYQGFTKIGVLTVVKNCPIPEGCGPTYKLWDSSLKTYTPLLGDLKFEDNEFIIGVQGAKTFLPKSEYGHYHYDGPTTAITVSSYKVLNTIKYTDFLWRVAKDYTLKHYPCLMTELPSGEAIMTWRESYAWEVDERAILKVRLTELNPFGTKEILSSYELWYDGDTGEFIQEISDFQGEMPCLDESAI